MNSEVFSYFHTNNDNILTPESELWQHGKTREAPDTSRIDAFQKELSNAEIKAIELLCYRDINSISGNNKIGISFLKGIPMIIEALATKIGEKMANQ